MGNNNCLNFSSRTSKIRINRNSLIWTGEWVLIIEIDILQISPEIGKLAFPIKAPEMGIWKLIYTRMCIDTEIGSALF